MEREDKMNITGEYVFYEDGKEICRKSNLLTKFGKRFLTSYLAGAVTFEDKDIAVGIGSTTPTVDDTQLVFEFYRSAVNLGSIDIQTNAQTGASTYAVVYKTTIPTDIVGTINEVGLFPTATQGNSDFSSRFISTFENNLSWTDDAGIPATTVSSPAPKIGNTWFSLSANAGLTKQYNLGVNFNLSGYSQNDSLTLAFKQQDTNLDYVYVRFYSSSTDYYEIRFVGDSSLLNKVVPLQLSNLYSSGFNSGSPDQESIIKISVGAKAKAGGNTTVLLDGLRINDEDSFNAYSSIISRSVLTTPIVKTYGREIDVEYRIGLSFS
jgi:TPR repeat protein